MLHGPIGLYFFSAAATTSAILAAEPSLPVWAVVFLAMSAPVVPVVVGFMLTRRKMSENSKKVEEIHLLVDGRLDAALRTLQEVLRINVDLKDQLGHYVSEHERVAAEGLHDLAMSETQIEDIHEQSGAADGD